MVVDRVSGSLLDMHTLGRFWNVLHYLNTSFLSLSRVPFFNIVYFMQPVMFLRELLWTCLDSPRRKDLSSVGFGRGYAVI